MPGAFLEQFDLLDIIIYIYIYNFNESHLLVGFASLAELYFYFYRMHYSGM